MSLTRALKDEWWILALVFASVIGALVIGGLNFFDAVNSIVLSIFWFCVILALIAALIRLAYLPIRYVRHRSALRKALDEDSDLARRLEVGDPLARVRASWSSWSHRDPRDIPWYRW
jgi:MFS family permease